MADTKLTIPDDINAQGFIREMFRIAPDGETDPWDTYLSTLAEDMSDTLEATVGPDTYNSTDTTVAQLVKKTELYLVCAELVHRRINIRLGDIRGSDVIVSLRAEREQRQSYMDDADSIIESLVNNTFSTSTVEYDHFTGDVSES